MFQKSSDVYQLVLTIEGEWLNQFIADKFV
jgi:hypothetical protein